MMRMNRTSVASLEYVTDSIIIERYMGQGMRKNAGAMSDVFSSIGESIKAAIAALWDPARPVASLMALGAKGVLTALTGGWSILIQVICEEIFHINFIDVFEKVKEYVVGLFKGGKAIRMSDISTAVDQGMGAAGVTDGVKADDHLSSVAYNDSEYVFKRMNRIRKAFFSGKIEKQAQLGALLKLPYTIVAGALKKLIPNALAKSFLGKLLKFVFTTGVTAVAAGTAGKLITKVVPSIGGGSSEPSYKHRLTPTTFGTEIMPSEWSEDIPQSQIGTRVMEWVLALYPELKTQEARIKQLAATSSKFQTLLAAIRENNTKNFYVNLTSIPDKVSGFTIKSKADVVNFFIEDIAKALSL